MDPFELMESMMQVSMVEDDKPLDFNIDDDPECNEPAEAIKTDSTDISSEELAFYRHHIGDVNQIKFMRLHCTGCNVHIGTAPSAHNSRYEHPLLKVLICETCYKFYTSGDFEKDEDGSELYCRWCGQGGVVYCCARCPYVFCKKCIKRNNGRAMVNHIENSDDWLCYSCNPKDIWMLRALFWGVRQYGASKLAIPPNLRTPEDIAEMDLDQSLCCKKRGSSNNKPPKIHPGKQRKSLQIDIQGDEGRPNLKRIKLELSDIMATQNRLSTPPGHQQRTKYPKILPKPVTSIPIVSDSMEITTRTAERDSEVVCTPDIISIDDSPPTSPAPGESIPPKKFLQVKPTSKLLDPKKERKYKKMQYPSSPPPMTMNPKNLAKNTQLTTMLTSIHQNTVNAVDVPKVIKIVSPDGRSFYIDPSKVGHPSNNTVIIPHGPPPPPLQLIQSMVPPPPPQIISQISHNNVPPLWLENGIAESQKVSQTISNALVKLSTEQKKLPPNYAALYIFFQSKLKFVKEKIENIKQHMKNDYITWVNDRKGVFGNTDFGQHFLSHPDSIEDALQIPVVDPFLACGYQVTSEYAPGVLGNNISHQEFIAGPSNINIDMNHTSGFENHSDSSSGAILHNILSNRGQEHSTENFDGDSRVSNSDLNNDAEKRPEPSPESTAMDELKALKEKLVLLENIIDKKKKVKSSRKQKFTDNSVRTNLVPSGEFQAFDDIFDMDVTCDSDEMQSDSDNSGEEASIYSIASSDSDSDCMVVSPEAGRKKSRKSRPSSAASDNASRHSVRSRASNNANSEPETMAVAELEKRDEEEGITEPSSKEAQNEIRNEPETEEHDELEIPEVETEKLTSDENPPLENSDQVVESNEENNSSMPEESNSRNETEIVDDRAEKITNTPVVSVEDESKKDSLDVAEAAANENTGLTPSGANSEHKDRSKTPFTSSLTDLVSIAQALRESMMESGLQPHLPVRPRVKRPKLDDLELLLSSNVVFRTADKSVNNSTTINKTADLNDLESDVDKHGKSFVDAFSNFVATSTDSSPEHPDDVEEELDNSVHTNGRESQSNHVADESGESSMAVLQKLAENCIPASGVKDMLSESTSVDC